MRLDFPACFGTYPFGAPEDKATRDCASCFNEKECTEDSPRPIPYAGPIPPSSALATQVGGGHYKDMKIQPVEFIHANNIPFVEGCVIKYVSRWRNKNGVDDLKKARHFLDLLIELETRNQ